MAVPLSVRSPAVELAESWEQETQSRVETTVANELSDAPDGSQQTLALPPCPVLSAEEIEPVKAFVANAVCYAEDSKAPQGYRAVLDCLRKGDDPLMLLKVLLALRTAGSTLNHLTRAPKRHAHLVHLILRLDPFEPPATSSTPSEHTSLYNDYTMADAHLHLVVALVSANSVFLTPAMNAVWKLLQNEAEADRTSRLHAALATLLRLVPKGNTDLFPVLASHFPFRTKPKSVLEWYTRQCLSVTKYAPAVYGRLMELLIDKCLEIDVEIKIDDGGQVSIEEDNDVFELELGTGTNEEEKTEVSDKVDEMADKLDALMLIIFDHIRDTTKTDASQATLFFTMISPVFESCVLTTHRSKFVQFVIFYVCGLEVSASAESADGLPLLLEDTLTTHPESLYRNFCSKLIDIVFDNYRATVTRQSGACYLASFLSRASYVCAETVCETVCALLRWGEAYVESIQAGSAIQQINVRDQCEMHSLFYTVCQAAFYIMCFRGPEAVEYYKSATDTSKSTEDPSEADGSTNVDPEFVDISPPRWERLCGHKLQPLRYCLESVRGEFLCVAHVFNLLESKLLDRLMTEDRNMVSSTRKKKKPTLIATAATLDMRRKAQGVGGLGCGRNPLDSFFPFDPYLLRRSHQYIDQFYREWEGSVEESDAFDHANIVVPNEEQSDSDDSIDGDPSDRSTVGSDVGTPESVDSTVGLEAMSLSLSKSLVSKSARLPDHDPFVESGSNALFHEREVHTKVLTEPFKRPREPSIEQGSW